MLREPSNFPPKTHPFKIAKVDRSWGRVKIIIFVSFPVDRLQWACAQMQAYSASLQSGHLDKLRVNFSFPNEKKTARVSMDYRLPPPLGNGTFHLRLLIKTLRESV